MNEFEDSGLEAEMSITGTVSETTDKERTAKPRAVAGYVANIWLHEIPSMSMLVASEDTPGLMAIAKLYSYTDKGIKVNKEAFQKLHKHVNDYLTIPMFILIGMVGAIAPQTIQAACGDKVFTGFIHIRRLMYVLYHAVNGPAYAFVLNQTKVGSCIICSARENIIRQGRLIHTLSGVHIVTKKLYHLKEGVASSVEDGVYYTAWTCDHHKSIDTAAYQAHVEAVTSQAVYILSHPDFTYEHPHVHVINRNRIREILCEDFMNCYHSWKYLKCGRLRRGAGDNYTLLGSFGHSTLFNVIDRGGQAWIIARSYLYVLGYLPGLPLLDDKEMDCIKVWVDQMSLDPLMVRIRSMLATGYFPVSHDSQIEGDNCRVLKHVATFTDQIEQIDLP